MKSVHQKKIQFLLDRPLDFYKEFSWTVNFFLKKGEQYSGISTNLFWILQEEIKKFDILANLCQKNYAYLHGLLETNMIMFITYYYEHVCSWKSEMFLSIEHNAEITWEIYDSLDVDK